MDLLNISYVRTHLSAIARRVEQGETIGIVRGGRLVAEFGPVGTSDGQRRGGTPAPTATTEKRSK